MKTYNRTANGVTVKVWNDSCVDWMIQDSERTTGYPIKTFTMKEAVKLHGEIFGARPQKLLCIKTTAFTAAPVAVMSEDN